jgi:Na+-transporting NADH:ubiquinone oxidoreductase subunit NqrB
MAYWTSLRRDPRHYQIAVLSALLLWGAFGLDLEVRPGIAAVVLATALAVQWLGTRRAGLPRFDAKSALISALSLTLLLRTASPWLAALAAVLAIGSKFVLRVPAADGAPGGKHVFNPTAFGIAAVLLLSDSAHSAHSGWVSPGQWGSAAVGAFAVACLGFLVVRRAERSDVTWAFLAAYGAVVFGRALWLGDPLAIPLHQLASGAFLIFAFFMISDPKTTPDSRAGRVLFACLVALGAGFVHFVLFRPNGLLWSLAALAPLVPVIDRLLPGRRYVWPRRSAAPASPAAGRALVPASAPAGAGLPLLERSAS